MTTVELKKQDREINVETDRVVKDDEVRKKYYIAELVRKALNQYLDYDNLYADNKYSLYTLPIVNEATDFIDFDIKSLSVHIVPTINKSKNKNVYIPKAYKIYGCKPDIIVFVDFNATLTKMNIVGFIKNVDLNTTAIPKTALNPVDDLILALKTMSPNNGTDNDSVVQVANELMLAFVDSSLSEEGEQFFLKHIVSNRQIRKNYKLFSSLDTEFANVAKQHKLLTDENFVAINSLPEEEFDIHQNPETDNYSSLSESIQEDVIDDLKSAIEDFDGTFGGEQEETPVDVDELLLSSDEPVGLIDDVNVEDVNTNFQSEEIEVQEELQTEPIDNQDATEIVDTQEEDVTSQSESLHEDAELTELDFSDFDADESLTLDSDMGELSLQDESLDDVSDIAHVPNEEQVVENDNKVQETPQEEPVAQIEEISQEPAVIQEENNIAEESSVELSAENEGESGDDLFSFLSEMADEVNEENQEEQPQQAQEIIPPMQDEQNEYIPPQQEEHAPDESEQPVVELQTEQNMINDNSFNNAFDSSEDVQQAQQPSEMENQQPQNKKPALSPQFVGVLAVALLAGGLYGVYANKDKIPFLNKTSEIQGLAEEKSSQTEDLPAPIADLSGVDTAVPKNDAEQNAPTPPAPDAVAPAPTAQAEKAPASVPNATTGKTSQELPSLPTAVEPPKPKHLNDAIATALTKDFSGVRISKVSWEVSETLLSNSDVKTYLTIAGKSIKNALAQDLMAATEPSFKDIVAVNVTYKKDGSVAQVRIVSSSGSNQIDEIIVKSIKNTLNYIKMPSLNLDKPEYTAKLLVRL